MQLLSERCTCFRWPGNSGEGSSWSKATSTRPTPWLSLMITTAPASPLSWRRHTVWPAWTLVRAGTTHFVQLFTYVCFLLSVYTPVQWPFLNCLFHNCAYLRCVCVCVCVCACYHKVPCASTFEVDGCYRNPRYNYYVLERKEWHNWCEHVIWWTVAVPSGVIDFVVVVFWGWGGGREREAEVDRHTCIRKKGSA